jgi:hypothetical protein
VMGVTLCPCASNCKAAAGPGEEYRCMWPCCLIGWEQVLGVHAQPFGLGSEENKALIIAEAMQADWARLAHNRGWGAFACRFIYLVLFTAESFEVAPGSFVHSICHKGGEVLASRTPRGARTGYAKDEPLSPRFAAVS